MNEIPLLCEFVYSYETYSQFKCNKYKLSSRLLLENISKIGCSF